MNFASPLFLVLLPVVLIWPWIQRTPNLRWSSLRVMSFPMGFRERIAPLTSLLASLVGLLLVVSLARPQWVNSKQIIEKDGLDIMLVVDTSGSMEARDYRLQGREVTRMEVTRSVLQEFVQKRPNDRLGLVVFGEEAFTQVPLTLDHDGMGPFLQQVDLGLAGPGATAIGDAIAVAARRLRDLDAPSRVMILLTDGQSNAGLNPLVASKAVEKLGIKIYTIGIGAERGAFFGLLRGRSELDEETLQTIATLTGGQYFRAKDTQTLREVYAAIDELEPSSAEFVEFVKREERFAPWLVTGLGFLLFLLVLEDTWLRRLP